ncbi:MAG TPA: ABC transporter substrate-binding protein, partial [Thermomicrobiales bacterium]|nr:ABC transporter substrate-binding protein [Thermomicrobiales bacterium]
MVSQNHASGPLRALYEGLKAGNIDRRTFVHRASLLGISAASAVFLANTAGVAAQDASPAATAAAERPAAGTENQERGAGGELKLIQWQAPTLLSPHVATGVKDFLASVLVLEPLMHYLPDATMIPNLVTEVPSVENGSLSEDLTEVTLKLLPDVVWSDGEPFTAEDVVFTIDWVKNPENASVNI